MPSLIYLVDDHPIMRDGIKLLLQREEDMQLCGEAVNAAEALQALNSGVEPDLLVVDLSLPGISGLDLIKQVRSLYPDLLILTLSAHDESVYAERVIRAGAQGYVAKHASSNEIIAAMRKVLGGGIALSQKMHQHLVRDHFKTPKPSPVERLSDREFEVFEHIGHGKSTADIASMMCISPKTVESHRQNIKKKINVDTSNQLVQQAAVWVATQGVPPPAPQA
ncbi:response regulator [Rubricoccus marinus]|uniref:DNA-binding response regulator n=1 Tax=Rubricoccus marinus TaxID=716817 RepID=A0A259TZX1_9BACT|nr:response regulator transcription factor [Rubricoccus marinus]OZC03325.1 hypothetical protein BSZ36_10235 [Rubricoccus marinus]